ncbi:MAG TPA: glycosyltransferase family 39 protein [candidate division Zixibacteria bacterium]|nr:glycosyltransferase family 39 protein [candidate division Zixibacteria bacterium]
MAHRRTWLVLILLVAAFLRLAALDEIPPGLTHDEADHGLDAWGVVNGVRPLYFTVGYGREPLFDYSTAGLMTFLGPSFMAGRLAAAFFSLILVAGTYAWIRRSFNGRVALLAAAGVAVSFWAVMTGRQALRSVTFPALFALAAYFYWTALSNSGRGRYSGQDSKSRSLDLRSPTSSFLIAGIILGITFYAYLPARIMWVIFPAHLFFVLLFNRPLFSKTWRGTVLMLVAAILIAAPLFIFLATNPGAEVRLDQLSGPLEAATRGDFEQLLANAAGSLKLFMVEGDILSRYNIPGRPFLSIPMAVLFIIGLIIAAWWVITGIKNRHLIGRASPAFFALIWLVVGLSPALITGPDASTTRVIGMLPVLYLFPAIPLAGLLDSELIPRRISSGLVIALFAIVFTLTVRDYFAIWANDPEVRVQYETSLVSALRYLDAEAEGPAAISNTTPDRYHSPSVALLTVENPDLSLRWFNGHHSLIAPEGDEGITIFTGFAPLNPDLEPYFAAELREVIPLRTTDIDRPVLVYSTDGPSMADTWQDEFQDEIISPSESTTPVLFGEAAEFLGYDLQTQSPTPGSEVRLATLWRVRQPLENAVLFTQVIGQDGLPIAQADRLDVPGYYWHPGDVFIQLHRFQLPESTQPGEYTMIVGLYTRPDLVRQPVIVGGSIAGDYVQLPPLHVAE